MKKSFIFILFLWAVTISTFAFKFSFVDIDEDRMVCYITASPTETYKGDLILPKMVTIDGYEGVFSVWGICDNAFKGNTQITSVVVPGTYYSIGKSAFDGCTGLKKIVLEAGVKEINDYAFRGCTSTDSIFIPKSISASSHSPFSRCTGNVYLDCTYIENLKGMLDGCQFTSIIIGQHCNDFGEFHTSLYSIPSQYKKVIIEDSENDLHFEAYSSYGIFAASKIESVYLGRNLTGKMPFDSYQNVGTAATNFAVNNIATIEFGKKITTLPSHIFRWCSKITDIVIPDNITTIGMSAFEGAVNLTSVTFSKGLKTIDSKAFYDCKKILEIFIPDNVQVIGKDAFNYAKTAYIGSGIQNLNAIRASTLYLCSLLPPSIKEGSTSISTNATIYVPNPDIYKNTENWSGRKIQALVQGLNANNVVYGSKPYFTYSNKVEELDLNFDDAVITSGSYTSVKTNIIKGNWSSTTFLPCEYTVSNAPLSIVANSYVRKFGEENPELSYKCVGLVYNETEDVLLAKPTLSTVAIQNSKPGNYDIVVTGGSANNYDLNYINGTLTIEKANQEILWNQGFDGTTVDSEIALVATASSEGQVSFSSSDESIAQIINRNGMYWLKTLKEGEVTITANQEGTDCYEAAKPVSKTFVVKPVVATGISLNYSKLSLNVGGEIALIANVQPENTSNKAVVWTTSNEAIATIENGNVIAIGVGDVEIKATTTDGSNLSAVCNLTVKPILITDITLSDLSLEVSAGSYDFVIATITPNNATIKTLKWESSDPAVATVENGMVTGVKQGSCLITVSTTDGSNISKTFKVKVNPAATKVLALSQSEISLYPDDKATLTATLDGVSTTDLTWKSSDTEVVKVVDGKITAVGVGTANIIATTTDGTNVSAQCKVTVNPILVNNIVLNITEATIEKVSLLELVASVYPDNATNKKLKWISTNESVASVTDKGMVLGKDEGTTCIVVSSTDGSEVTDTCYLVVEDPDGLHEILSSNKEYKIYDVNGRILPQLQNGLNIILFSDGTRKKILKK